MVQAVLADRPGERSDDVVLSEDLGRGLGPVPPVQSLMLLLARHVPPAVRLAAPPKREGGRAPTVDHG